MEAIRGKKLAAYQEWFNIFHAGQVFTTKYVSEWLGTDLVKIEKPKTKSYTRVKLSDLNDFHTRQ